MTATATCNARTADGSRCHNPVGPAGRCAAGHKAAGGAPATATSAPDGAAMAATDPFATAPATPPSPPAGRTAEETADLSRVIFKNDEFAFDHGGQTHTITRHPAGFNGDHALSCTCDEPVGTSDREVSATELVTHHARMLVHQTERQAEKAKVAAHVDELRVAAAQPDSDAARQVEFLQEAFDRAVDTANKAGESDGTFHTRMADQAQARLDAAVQMAVYTRTGEHVHNTSPYLNRMREINLITYDGD